MIPRGIIFCQVNEEIPKIFFSSGAAPITSGTVGSPAAALTATDTRGTGATRGWTRDGCNKSNDIPCYNSSSIKKIGALPRGTNGMVGWQITGRTGTTNTGKPPAHGPAPPVNDMHHTPSHPTTFYIHSVIYNNPTHPCCRTNNPDRKPCKWLLSQ